MTQPTLAQSYFLGGLVTPDELVSLSSSGGLEAIYGVAIPQSRIGLDEVKFTLVNEWQGEGRHQFAVEVQEETVGTNVPEVGFRWDITQDLTSDRSLWTPVAISLPSHAYGAVVVNSYCNGQLVRSQRFQVLPPSERS